MTDVREERKVVTAVFADIVGSTALAERVANSANFAYLIVNR